MIYATINSEVSPGHSGDTSWNELVTMIQGVLSTIIMGVPVTLVETTSHQANCQSNPRVALASDRCCVLTGEPA